MLIKSSNAVIKNRNSSLLFKNVAKVSVMAAYSAILSPSSCNAFQSIPSSSNSVKCLSTIGDHKLHSFRFYNPHARFNDIITKRQSSSDSSFEPPQPPSFTGQPIFSDIDVNGMPKNEQYKSDTHAVFVVTGASRGIGFQLVQTLLDNTKGKIIACCRNPSTATKLNQFIDEKDASNRIHIHALDLQNESTINDLSNTIQSSHHNRVDILFNVAGILGDGSSTPGPERSFKDLDRTWVEDSFDINCIGPLMLAQSLIPFMVTESKQKKRIMESMNKDLSKLDEDSTTTSNVNRGKSLIVNLSAKVGSISDNNLGGWLSYRASKAALNQASRTLAHEIKRYGINIICYHPGTTDTDLSKPFQKNLPKQQLFPVWFTVKQLLNVVDCLEDNHSGGLYDWAGRALPF